MKKFDFGKINWLLKAIVVLSFVLLIWHLTHDQEDLHLLFEELKEQIRDGNKLLLVLVLALMPVNWLLEAIKWKALNNPIHPVSVPKAVKAVLMGLTISIFTPARVGEYLGRIINVRPIDKWKALAAQMIGSLIQLIVIAVAGIWGLYTLTRHTAEMPAIDPNIIIMITAIIFLILIAFTRAPAMILRLRQKLALPRVQAFLQQIQFVANYSDYYKTVIVLITIFRVAIYVLQYWLLLLFFGLDMPVMIAIAAILSTYLIQSGLPLPLLLGLFARGEVTLLVWKFFPVNELTLLSSSYLLWVINVFLPALIGAGILLKTDLPKSFGFEKK